MRIAKTGVERVIDESRWPEYSKKGYIKVEETKTETAELEADEEAELDGGDSEDSEPDSDETADFEKMTIAQLKKYAEENGIDLEGAERKADILRIITGRAW